MAFNFLSRITRDHQKLAEGYVRQGNKRQAAEEYAKAGDYQRAAGLAAEIQDEPKLIRYSLQGALGRLPPRIDGMDAGQAGGLLAHKRPFEKGIPPFGVGGGRKGGGA